ncbi:hypothetical protein [Nocardioides iriomotensis]|uniref:DUF4064 domain-containing protein n=1 Tax=Nocardioides iriomotensis TaxID=715784 RepID=A0A4Q5IX76_9ACTN|nr:hypothetical protein [Nocardioides iriomotensis]RYU10767.1 hypothetical protein ETU37_16100 [Nocardioides iriomotensis]
MSDTVHPRPRQVTTAGVMGVAGSVLVILSLFDTLASLRTVEVREQVERYLASPQGQDLGVSTGGFLDVLHVMVLANGAFAAAAAVLGVYVFQRHQGARLGFTIAAGLLVVGMWIVAGFLPSVLVGVTIVVAFAAALMWSPPARDWFAGRAPRPVESPTPRGQPAQPVQQRTPPSPSWAPPAVPHRDDAPAPSSQPAPASYPFGEQRPTTGTLPYPEPSAAGAAPGARAGARRPGAVVAALLMTWLCSGAVLFAFGIVLLMLLLSQDTLISAARQNPAIQDYGLTTADLLSAFWVTVAIFLFWSLAGIVLAVLAWRRVTYGWVLLVVSAAMSALVGFVTFPFGLLVGIPAALTAGLLVSGPARRWYLQRDQLPPGQPGRPGQPQQPEPPRSQPPVW